jgi:hypothetical protein
MTMKVTKARIDKLFSKENQTKKRFKNKKVLNHTHTFRRKKPFNLKNNSLNLNFRLIIFSNFKFKLLKSNLLKKTRLYN